VPLAALNEIYQFGMMECGVIQLSKSLQQLIEEEKAANNKLGSRDKAMEKTTGGYFACRPHINWFSCSFKWCKCCCCM